MSDKIGTAHLREIEQDEELLQYRNGYWSGVDRDKQLYLKFPDVLFQRHYQAELEERGIDTKGEQASGRRAEAFQDCRRPAYWRQVTDPRLKRTSH